MNDTHAKVLRALASLGVWPEDDGQILRQLGDGPTNQTWLLEHNGAPYVLRLVKPLARKLGMELAAELEVVRSVAGHHLAPGIVAASVERGVVLSHYITGRTWSPSDLRQPVQLERLARLLRAVHRVPCAAPAFDVAFALREYAALSEDARADKWARDALATTTVMAPRRPVLCHNDPIAANILDDGNLYLVDWEYAATGDPLFDIAVVVAHHELDASLTSQFMQAYQGHADAAAQADLARWRFIYDRLVALWLSVLEADDNSQLSPQQTTQLQSLRRRLS